jgi:ribonuclease HIII
MRREALQLDRLVRDWSLGISRDQAQLGHIAERALTTEPSSLLQFARALHVLESQSGGTLRRRIDELRQKLEALRIREHQIDDLGNLDNDPETLFDVLGDDVSELRGFDAKRIRQARVSQSSRADAARAFLDVVGWDHIPTETADALTIAIEDLAEREQFESWGLFVESAAAHGWALGIRVLTKPEGEELLWSDATTDIREQARIAFAAAMPGQGWEAQIEWPASYAGESIGLPLYIAGLVARSVVPRHALTASTGRIVLGGRVVGVTGIVKKVEAARRIGIRRLLVQKENAEEASSTAGNELAVIGVSNVTEVIELLRQSARSIQVGVDGLIRLVRASVPDYGLIITNEVPEPSGCRFVVSNAQGTANIWVHSNGRVRSDGADGPARAAADRLINERTPAEPETRGTDTFRLPGAQLQDTYRANLQRLGALSEPMREHELWRMKLTRGRSRATVVLYSSGKCVLQGTAPAWDEARAAAESTTQSIGGLPATKPSPAAAQQAGPATDETEPHIGTDEAGKGDYFGPLVSAAVFVDGNSAARLRELGVRDSKTLSDRRVRELADKIRHLPDVRYAVTPINPRKFNELYEQFRREGKNLNSLLAWGHARSIDTLLSAPASKRANPKFALVDQFADKHYIEQRMRKFGIPIHQRHKAEEDIAVAAASVLARDGFLQWLERMSLRTQIPLPKGASPQVIEAAKQFVRRWGAKWLGEVAKLSFRTTAKVLEGEDTDGDKRSPNWVNEQSDSPNES